MAGSLRILFLSAVVLVIGTVWVPAERPLENVALISAGTRVQADTEYGEHVGAAKAADGVVGYGTACWFSRDQTPLPCTLTFEFSREERLRRAVLYQAQWSGNMYHTKDFALEVSPDGREWKRVAQGTLVDDNAASVSLDLDVRTRWLRVVVLSSYNAFQTCGLSEVELYAERPLRISAPTILLNGARPLVSADTGNYNFAFQKDGPQVLLERGNSALTAALRAGETVQVNLRVSRRATLETRAVAELLSRGEVMFMVTSGARTATARLRSSGGPAQQPLHISSAGSTDVELYIKADTDAVVRISELAFSCEGYTVRAPLTAAPTEEAVGPPPDTPALRQGLQREMIRLDWEAQDGIGTSREPATYEAAIEAVIAQGTKLAERLHGIQTAQRAAAAWNRTVAEWRAQRERVGSADEHRQHYRRLREAKREMLFAAARDLLGPVVFVKQVPGCFSHQLTQYYGRYARPGGGVFVLLEPGRSMAIRELVGRQLAAGSYMHPEVSWDGQRILFAYCHAETTPSDTIQGHRGRHYHLYEIRADGTRLRQLTDGPFDDFAPKYLPDDRIVFVSTRRGGWHRCGTPGCENYVLTVADRNGSNPKPLSYHETQEWDPAVLPDGRLVYT